MSKFKSNFCLILNAKKIYGLSFNSSKFWRDSWMSRHTGGGDTEQCHKMTHGGGGLKSSKKVSHIIWIAPKIPRRQDKCHKTIFDLCLDNHRTLYVFVRALWAQINEFFYIFFWGAEILRFPSSYLRGRRSFQLFEYSNRQFGPK